MRETTKDPIEAGSKCPVEQGVVYEDLLAALLSLLVLTAEQGNVRQACRAVGPFSLLCVRNCVCGVGRWFPAARPLSPSRINRGTR